MGLFSKSSGAMEEMLVQALQARGFSPRDAKKNVKGWLQECGQHSAQQGQGDVLLQRAQGGDAKAQEFANKRRSDGVTDDDIRWYWNLSDVEKCVLGKLQEMDRMTLFLSALEEFGSRSGITKDEAAALAGERVRKFHPLYGDPSEGNGDDRPLMPELKDRVDRYIERRARTEPSAYKTAMEEASSFNALVRAEIRARNL